MKTIICETKEWAARAADEVCAALRKKPDAVLALACGRTMAPLWDELAARCAGGTLSLNEARILCATELCAVPEEKSCRHALTKGLLETCGAQGENCHFPDAADPQAYDRLIEELAGIDLAVLGLGENCHIGYNEPGTLYDTRTHVQKLTERTKRQLLKRGFTESDMPDEAVTLGIKTLCQARQILALARGEDKAAAVYQMLYAKTMSYIPASFLQIPLQVTVVLDPAAAAQL